MARRTSVLHDPIVAGQRKRSFFPSIHGGASRSSSFGHSQDDQDLWATCFNIRVAVPQTLHQSLLQDRRMDDPKSHLGRLAHGSASESFRRLFNRRLARILKMLAILSIFFAPTHLAVWPLCEVRQER